ncbi:MAG: restriction endonuclease subunit S [Saprospiraceae bacterium]
MKSNYSELGEYIREVNERNSNLAITKLLGVSMEKTFIQSVANLNGVDMSVYKVLRKEQLACKLMSVGRDEKLPVDLYKEQEPSIVSSAYYVFEPKDKEELLPEYLMMWLCRPENDRYIGFISGGDVRGGISWETFCSLPIKVPSINKQKEIVKEYNVIQDRISLNNQLVQKLEETADTIYNQRFVDELNDNWEPRTLDYLCSLITDGKHGDCEDEENSGYYFLSAKDLRNNSLIFNGARQITKRDFVETHRRTNLKPGDICMVNTGATIGRMSIAPDNPFTLKSTFQKSVAILKPRKNVTHSYYLYCLLRNNINEITELGSGTSQANLLIGDMKKYVVKYPPYERIIDFESKVIPVFQTRNLIVEENIRLNQLKNLLLSKLATIK